LRQKKQKYNKNKFSLKECEAHINVVSRGEEEATAFLNIQLPDGRWAVFEVHPDCKIPLFKEKKEV